MCIAAYADRVDVATYPAAFGFATVSATVVDALAGVILIVDAAPLVLLMRCFLLCLGNVVVTMAMAVARVAGEV